MNSDINVTIVSGGGQSVVSYSLDNCSGGGTVTFTKNDSSDTWYTLSQSTTSLTINANAIPTTAVSRTSRINASVNGTTCAYGIVLTQNGPGCGCDAITSYSPIQITSPLAQTGVELISFTRNSSCTNPITITASAQQSWISSLSVSGNKIIGNITENSDHNNSRSQDITVSVNGTPCTAITVTQPALPCSCESVDFFLTADTITYDCYEDDNTYIIASADTHGCGAISASCQSAIFQEGHVYVNYYDSDDNSKCLIEARGISANPNPDYDRTTNILIYLFGSTVPCNKRLEVTQTKCGAITCDCSNITWYISPSGVETSSQNEINVSCAEGYISFTCRGQCIDGHYYYGTELEVTTTASWIQVYDSMSYSPYIEYTTNTNNRDGRSATVNVTAYYQGEACVTSSFTVNQSVYSACTCQAIMDNVSVSGNQHTIEFEGDGTIKQGYSSTIAIQLDEDNLPCACSLEDLGITFSSKPDWVDIGTRTSCGDGCYKWGISVSPAYEGERSGILHFDVPMCSGMFGVNIQVTQDSFACDCKAVRTRYEDMDMDATVSASSTTYKWGLGFNSCKMYATIYDNDKPSWINSITYNSWMYGAIDASFQANDGEERSYCFNVDLHLGEPTAPCLNKTICITQQSGSCSCDSADYNVYEAGGFSGQYCDEDGTTKYYYNESDFCYDDQTGSKYVYTIKKPNPNIPSEACKALDLRCISGDTNYLDVSLNTGYSSASAGINITILNNSIPADRDYVEISYVIEVYDVNGIRTLCGGDTPTTGTCTFERKTFRMYKSYECLEPCYHCNGSEDLLSITEITTSLTRSSSANYVDVATYSMSSDPKYRCLTVEAESTSSSIHVMMVGNTIRAWADDSAPLAATIDVYLKDLDGTVKQCQKLTISLTVS